MTGRPNIPMLAPAMVLCAGLATSLPAASSPQCGPRDSIIAVLAERYGETRQSVGLAENAVMEVFASRETGTWTIAVTTPDGTMCLVAAGQNFETVEEALPARGQNI